MTSWLDDILGKEIQVNGVLYPQRRKVNYKAGAGVTITGADNPATGATDLTFVNTTSAPNLAARTVYANATASSGVPSGLAATGNSDFVLREKNGVLEWAKIQSANIAAQTIVAANVGNFGLALTNLPLASALSVIGNSSNASNAHADIAASTDGDVLRRAGTALGFGRIVSSVIDGTTTNNNAPTGAIGEIVVAALAAGSAVSLTTATTANILSLSLTAGDWDVSGQVDFGGSPTGFSEGLLTLSTTSGTTTGTLGSNASRVPTVQSMISPVLRVPLATTTTVYLNVRGTFSGGTLNGYGSMRARRVR